MSIVDFSTLTMNPTSRYRPFYFILFGHILRSNGTCSFFLRPTVVQPSSLSLSFRPYSYGKEGVGSVPGNQTLIFRVSLVGQDKKKL